MNSAVVAVVVLILYFFGYRFYSRYISRRVFQVSDDELTPSHELKDDLGFVPTNKHVLFGHHFASIAGALRFLASCKQRWS
ncbi:MAG TPA: carbon starvation CstA family protein [Thermodesulfobacteriota bacterium]|jgi:carbon starvation protein